MWKWRNCYVVYRIGWFRKDNTWTDFDRQPNQPNLIPLQQTATDILGLEYKELNYGLNFVKQDRPIKKDYEVFSGLFFEGGKMTDETLKFYEELTTAMQQTANDERKKYALALDSMQKERDYYKRLAESYTKRQFQLDEWPGDKELLQEIEKPGQLKIVANDIPNLLKDLERKEFLRRLK